MADFLSLLMGIPGLMADFSGSTSDPYRKQQEQIAAQQAQYAQAAGNPNNPLYQQTYSQYQQQNKNNLAQVLAEAQGQNRMNQQNGRTPLFGADRGGETLFRSLMQGYQGMGAQSDAQTRAALTGAAGIGQQAQNQYGYITPNTKAGNTAQLSGYQGIYNLLKPQQPSTGSMGAGNYSQNNSGSGGGLYGALSNPNTNWQSYSY